MTREIQWYHLALGWTGLTAIVLCGGGGLGYLALTGGGGRAERFAPEEMLAAKQVDMATMPAPGAPPEAEDAEKDGGGFGLGAPLEIIRGKRAESAGEEARGGAVDPEPALANLGEDHGGAEEVALRQWFPEAFLWAPLVSTDADGTGTVDVRVPDQLTTWRVLGLAHDRAGHQTGAVTTFDSRLPLYVEPVVPDRLIAGDEVVLPVQVVNATDAAIEGVLQIEASGPLSREGASSPVVLAPWGTAVREVVLVAGGAGIGVVEATLRAGETGDAARREIPIAPRGRPVVERRGGTVSSTRVLTLAGPEGADPRTQELLVRVFPGPLAVLQAEVERLAAGAQVVDGAYGSALAHALEALAARAGVDLDPRVQRKLRLVAWQRLVRAARAPDAGVAADLLQALSRRGPGATDALLEGLVQRLVRVLVEGQRGDGTWARQADATLQQVLVQTALAARALPPTEAGARLRASGAIERYAREVKDGYTAAMVLATGLVTGDRAEHLQRLVDEATPTREDGSRTVRVPGGARNPWGQAPSHAEMLAWVALVSSEAVAGDLVAELMGGYDARGGFGAGPADAVALEAVARALPGLERPAEVVLRIGDREVARAEIDPAQPLVPAALVVTPGAGPEVVSLAVEPPVTGLAWVAQLTSWVPWTSEESVAGVEVVVEAEPMAVGRDATLTVSLSAPSGVALAVEQGLPAGAVVDEAALAALGGILTAWEVHPDHVRVVTRPFQAGEVLELPLVVRPSFAGRFTTGPLVVEHAGVRRALAPLVWVVAGGRAT